MMQFTIPHKRRKRIQAIAAALRAVDTEDELGLGKELQAFILNHRRAVELLRDVMRITGESELSPGLAAACHWENCLERIEIFLHELEGK